MLTRALYDPEIEYTFNEIEAVEPVNIEEVGKVSAAPDLVSAIGLMRLKVTAVVPLLATKL